MSPLPALAAWGGTLAVLTVLAVSLARALGGAGSRGAVADPVPTANSLRG
ncbi:hypothetical protein PV396_04575 [Streptomyces sp. ME02-8801-2C]|nr:hypothetical protein [Streptomyces sp. ME02-8801-2C]MDX3451228.1 hypothetical protein [Streptomyces sp. ME02-8801-2C]